MQTFDPLAEYDSYDGIEEEDRGYSLPAMIAFVNELRQVEKTTKECHTQIKQVLQDLENVVDNLIKIKNQISHNFPAEHESMPPHT